MQRRCAAMLGAIRWDRAAVARFLGCWLSEPKPTVFFDRPAPALSRAGFLARARKRGVRLDPRTQLLYDDRSLFINGAAQRWPVAGAAAMRELANARALPPRTVAAATREVAALLHDWYRHGYLH